MSNHCDHKTDEIERMNNKPAEQVRNFAIAGHAGSGKTALSDLILFKSGAVARLGSVDQKTSVSDYRPEEQEKGCSLYASPLTCEWNDTRLFFIDTPGNADFFGDTVAALNICDMALIVVDGVDGVEIGTTRSWRVCRQHNIPRAILINSLDRENSDFDRVLESVQEAYGRTACVPMTIPVGAEANLSKVVSVLGSDDIPDELADEVKAYKSQLTDTAAESDEELMMRYLEGEELTEEEVVAGLHSAIISGDLIPVFAGSVGKDIGIEELLNGLVSLGPNPLVRGSIPTTNGDLEVTTDGTGHAFVFKSLIDPFVGQLNMFHVYSGTFTADSELRNVTQGEKDRIGGLLVVNGKDQEPIDSAGPGDIIAIAKLKNTKINDTVNTDGSEMQFPPIVFPKPTMSYACYAVKKGEEDKITTGLLKLSEEDPTAQIRRDAETHEILLDGLGDQHLSVIVARLKANYKVDIELRTPKVPYREAITGNGKAVYRHKKQTGGHGQFAEVHLRVEVTEEEFEFVNEVVGGNIPRNFIPAVEKGVRAAMERGPLANCRVIGIRSVVYDGKHHPVDSSDMAFQIASRSAFREAMRSATPILLEPIQTVRVTVPDEYMGDIHGDLNHRRGRILGMEMEEGLQVVQAEVPLSEMFSYSTQLRSLTQGRGSFDMEFARYDQVPANIARDIQEKAGKDAEDE